jgi:hypothetical protein
MATDYSNFSELEREFELEMEDGRVGEPDLELEGAEQPQDREGDEDSEFEFEQDEEVAEFGQTGFELPYGNGSRSGEFVDRLLEISSREYESAAEVDEAMNEVLDDIEREYFLGAIKRGLKSIQKNKVLRSLASKGLKLGINKFVPGLQGALQLARGNVKGALLNFGKQAIGSVVPGGTIALDAMKSIGLGAGEEPAEERETWENYVTLAREAYEHLADNLTTTADKPAEATRLASNAVQHAIREAQTRTAMSRADHRGGPRPAGRVVRLRVRPGERVKLIIACA